MDHIRFLGHATFEIVLGGTKLLFDPWFGTEGGRTVGAAASPEDFKDTDYIMVTHEHFDHLDKGAVEAIAGRTAATVVAPKPVLRQLELPERRKVDVTVGDRFQLGDLEVAAVRAVHPQSVYPVGFVVKKDGRTVYHAGDTYEYLEMRDINVDYALLPIGGTYTMDPYSANRAVFEMRARVVIPMHYNTWPKIKQEAGEFVKGLKASTRGVVLNPGQKIQI